MGNKNAKQAVPQPVSLFDNLMEQNEKKGSSVAKKLKKVLSQCEVVLICDDSGSMREEIGKCCSTCQFQALPGTPSCCTYCRIYNGVQHDNYCKGTAYLGNPNVANGIVTRWSELKKLAQTLITYVTSINPYGMDIYFLNRPKLEKVNQVAGLDVPFKQEPDGYTPLLETLDQVYRDKGNLQGRKLLIIVVTDGQPTTRTGNVVDQYSLKRKLQNKPNNTYISFAECTDVSTGMEYIDEWVKRREVYNFANTDDYREHLLNVRKYKGPGFKCDYNDYVEKIILGPFYDYYKYIDEEPPCCCCYCNCNSDDVVD